jgi:UDP-N-acetylglucosamine:LPS N-acetylglucosamine transferase
MSSSSRGRFQRSSANVGPTEAGPPSSDTGDRADLLLVCSCGGHLLTLWSLRSAWEEFSRVWVTFEKSDSRSLLGEERVVFAHGPTNRNLKNTLRNLPLAWRTIRAVRPKVVLTTGAGVAVPFAWIGRLYGARVVFVESISRIDDLSLSCRLVARICDRIYVQWPDLGATSAGLRYAGQVFFHK